MKSEQFIATNEENYLSDSIGENIKYDDNVVEIYEKLTKDMRYHSTSMQSTILHQLLKSCGNTTLLSGIDVACGNGAFMRYTIEQFTNQNDVKIQNMVGVDISQSQIKQAKILTPKSRYPKISFEVVNASKLYTPKYNSLHNKFDFAVCRHCFNYAPNVNVLNNMMRSVYSVLKHNGIAFVETVTMGINENPKLCRILYGDNTNEFGFKFHDEYDNLCSGQMARCTIGFTEERS
eukprot:152104_1